MEADRKWVGSRDTCQTLALSHCTCRRTVQVLFDWRILYFIDLSYSSSKSLNKKHTKTEVRHVVRIPHHDGGFYFDRTVNCRLMCAFGCFGKFIPIFVTVEFNRSVSKLWDPYVWREISGSQVAKQTSKTGALKNGTSFGPWNSIWRSVHNCWK